MLGEINNAHAHIHRAIEYQVALVDLDSCQIIVEDIGPSKCLAGDEAPEFVHAIAPASHQPASAGFPWSSRRPSCSSACIDPSQSRGGLLPEICIHPDVRLYPRALVEPEGAMDFGQTHAQRRV